MTTFKTMRFQINLDTLTGHFNDIFWGPAMISSSSPDDIFTGSRSAYSDWQWRFRTFLLDVRTGFEMVLFQGGDQSINIGCLDEHYHKIEFL